MTTDFVPLVHRHARGPLWMIEPERDRRRRIFGPLCDTITRHDLDTGHGLFSTHQEDCQACLEEIGLLHTDREYIECTWREQGIRLFHVDDLPESESQAIAEAAMREDQAAEHHAAAGYPDPCERSWDAEGNEL